MGPLQDVTREDFLQSGWNQVIEECDKKEWREYSYCFGSKALEARESGDIKAQQIFVLLSRLTSLRLNLDSPAEPFGPMMVMDDRRTAVVDDFDETHLNFLKEIVGDVSDAELRSRIADILWVCKRDFHMAQLAVPAYLESAQRLEDPEHWPATVERIERALRIAAMLDRKGAFFTTVINHIETVLAKYDGEDPWFLSAKLMELLQSQRVGDAAEQAPRAEKAALRAEASKRWHLAREYWRVKARWHQLAKDEQQVRDALVQEAETHVKEAQDALKREPPSYIHAAPQIRFAIEAYRRIGGMRERVQELHNILLEYQQHSTSELIPLTSSVDMSKQIATVVEQFKGKALPDGLMELAQITKLPPVEQLRAQAQENKEKYLGQSLFSRVFINAMGRTIARQSEDPDESLQADTFSNASMIRGIYVQALVEPVRRQIDTEHYVRVADFLPFLINNPFVRPGREYIIARGLHAGLLGDFLTAVHFLVPQLEDSVRYMLSQVGVITSGLDDDGIQDEYNLNKMLTASEFTEPLAKIIGEDFVFDLS